MAWPCVKRNGIFPEVVCAGLEPLQRGGVGARAVLDRDRLRRRLGERDAQPPAEVRDLRLELVKASGLPPAVTDSMASPRVSRSRARALSAPPG